MTGETGRRAGLLLTVVGLALTLAACGRASRSDIFSAVGITPTPTRSPEEIASATSAAGASPGVDIASIGDVASGSRVFNNQGCVNCHVPGGGGTAPDLLAAGGPGASMTVESLTMLIREAPNDHPPGPYRSFEITDRQIGDLAAYILAESRS